MQLSLKCDVMRPSALGTAELDAWRQFMRQSEHLQRAFFSPEFAIACERAMRRAHVAVLHDGSGIQGFLAFEFQSVWTTALSYVCPMKVKSGLKMARAEISLLRSD